MIKLKMSKENLRRYQHSNKALIKILVKELPKILMVVFLLNPILALSCDYGDAIVDGSSADARNLVPILASDTASSGIVGLVFNGLVKYDKDINLVGDLAEGWDIEDEGLAIIFHLRKNIFWQDGVAFTAGDVEFTYQKLIDPNVRTPYSGDFERVKSLEVIDDHTLKVTYKEPFSPGLASWGMSIIPKHLLEKEDLNSTKFSRSPIGTGPYKFKKWITQQKIELTENPNYFEGRPYIDRYISRIIPDPDTLFLELSTQGIDWAALTPLQFKKKTEVSFFKKNYQKFRTQAFIYTYLGYNLDDPKFKDKKVRQALDFAVDKNEIIQGVLLGLGRPCTGPFIPESWAYNKEVKLREYNPEIAKELLKEAGWQDNDNDGILDKDGAKFEFTLITNQGNDTRIQTAQIIQRRLMEIGVNVKIKVIEWSSFLSEFIDKRRFEAILLGWSLGRDPDNYDIFNSSKTKEGEFNFVGYNNPEVDKLLDQGRRIFNQEERAKIYHRIHEIIYDEQPYMFLYVPDSLSVVHKRFQGIEPAPIGIGYNFIEWCVPKAQQRYKALLEKDR